MDPEQLVESNGSLTAEAAGSQLEVELALQRIVIEVPSTKDVEGEEQMESENNEELFTEPVSISKESDLSGNELKDSDSTATDEEQCSQQRESNNAITPEDPVEIIGGNDEEKMGVSMSQAQLLELEPPFGAELEDVSEEELTQTTQTQDSDADVLDKVPISEQADGEGTMDSQCSADAANFTAGLEKNDGETVKDKKMEAKAVQELSKDPTHHDPYCRYIEWLQQKENFMSPEALEDAFYENELPPAKDSKAARLHITWKRYSPAETRKLVLQKKKGASLKLKEKIKKKLSSSAVAYYMQGCSETYAVWDDYYKTQCFCTGSRDKQPDEVSEAADLTSAEDEPVDARRVSPFRISIPKQKRKLTEAENITVEKCGLDLSDSDSDDEAGASTSRDTSMEMET